MNDDRGTMNDERTEASRSSFIVPTSAFLFDVVGTLLYPDPAPANVYETVGRRYGSRLKTDEIARRFRAAFAAEEAADRRDPLLRTSEERERRRWQTIVAAVLDDVADDDAVFRELWNHFARPDAWRPFPDAAATVPELVRRGVTVGVASNFDARLHPILAAHFPTIRPERVFVSSEVGYRKPAMKFFDECTRRLTPAARPCTILLVGDDEENDFIGARAAGWNALLVDRDGRHPQLTPQVADLRQLPERAEIS